MTDFAAHAAGVGKARSVFLERHGRRAAVLVSPERYDELMPNRRLRGRVVDCRIVYTVEDDVLLIVIVPDGAVAHVIPKVTPKTHDAAAPALLEQPAAAWPRTPPRRVPRDGARARVMR